jgi:hypothetical protein
MPQFHPLGRHGSIILVIESAMVEEAYDFELFARDRGEKYFVRPCGMARGLPYIRPR